MSCPMNMRSLTTFGILLAGVTQISAQSSSQVFTFGKFDALSNPVASGQRLYAVSTFNDGQTRGTFLNSLKPNGSLVWSKNLLTTFGPYACHLLDAPKGGVILYGSHSKSGKIAVAGFDVEGKPTWKKEFPRMDKHQDHCVRDADGNVIIYHGPTPSLSMITPSGKIAWTSPVGELGALNQIVATSKGIYALHRSWAQSLTTSITELDRKGKLVKVRKDAIPGYVVAVRGNRMFTQEITSKAATFYAYSIDRGQKLWQGLGPRSNIHQAVVGASNDLTIACATNASAYSLAHFSPKGEMKWVKAIDPKFRLDALQSTGPGKVQALVVNYNMKSTALQEFTHGKLVKTMTLPLGPLSSKQSPFAKIGNDLYVFNVIGEFNPGETKASGLIGKVWKLSSKG